VIKLKDILQEEKILVPRHLEGRDEEYKRITYKKIQDYIKKGSKGNLNLYKVSITKLPDNLIEVGGFLNLWESQIYSLNNLQEVRGYLNLYNSKIQSLGNLQKVGEYLDLEKTSLKSLRNLQKVGGDLWLKNTSIKSLDNLKVIEGDLYLRNTFFSEKYSREEFIQMIKDKGIEVKGEIYI